ncbi:MAG: hypothetical protein NT077_01810 [Candidatus Taylorbacteria bacterium]|nr:hypothetical protein [Candidatus Taylorbacteria bacterium]
MKKTYTYIMAIAIAGILVTALPASGNAQTLLKARFQNAENNRDIRNEQLKQASSTRPFNRDFATSTIRLQNLAERAEMIASSTEFKGREKWKEARVEQFAILQSNLIAQIERSLNKLEVTRNKISARIDSAEQNGRTMTEARKLLVKADEKIAAAKVALAIIRSYVPPVISSSLDKTAAASSTSTVKLEKPREIGKKAIEAVNEAQKMLTEVIKEIAHSMGLKTGQEGNNQATTTP